MTTKHTPGPWHVGVGQAGVIVYNAKGWAIANAVVYHGEHDREECKANARLIAAAPDMLAALRMICDAGIPLAEPIERAMLDAIRKAEG